MALDPRYIPSIAFEQYMVDNETGLPLAGGYMEFYKDSDRETPKPVFEISGDPPNYTYTPLPNPLDLSSVGTPINNSSNPVNVYSFPYDAEGNVENYYVKIYSSENQLQKVWQAWPNATQESNPDNLVTGYQNQLANPQFAVVNFIPDEGMTIEFDSVLDNAEYDIAPGWVVVISSSGAGTLTIGKISIEGSLQIKTNPPDFISFLPTGANITNITLRQKLTNNPDIWSTTLVDNGYVSSCMLITSYDGQAHTIEMEYVQSSGPSSPQTLVSGSTGTEGYIYLNDTILLDAGTNTDNSDDGAIYIDISLPTIGFYGLTSVQVVGVGQDNITVDFQQEPVNRQKSQLFYHYQPQLNFKPIKSYLVGWDFPLNPAQFNGSSFTLGAYNAAYIWDQTIGFQTVDSSLAASRVATGPATGALKINSVSTAQYALIQYLTVPEIQDILRNRLCSNIILSSDQASLQGTISLWYTKDETLPSTVASNECMVNTLNSTGKPSSTNGNWIEIPRSSFGDAIFTLSVAGNIDNLQSFDFSGWSLDLLDEDLEDITYFAIVVGFSSLANTKNIVLLSCSLDPGDISTPPAPQTFEECLSECETYYEMTYKNGTIPGTDTIVGSKYAFMQTFYDQDTDAVRVYSTGFTDEFRATKKYIPTMQYYSPILDNDNDTVLFFTRNGSVYASGGSPANPESRIFSTYFVLENISHDRATYLPNTTSSAIGFDPGASTYTSGILYQRTADARLGA